MSLTELRARLINIYDKISRQSTLQVGLDLFKNLIRDTYTKDKCLFIIKELSDYTKKLNGIEKKESLILLPLMLISQQYINYLPKILLILSDNINHTTESIFEYISKIFGDIIIQVQEYDNNNLINDNLFIEFCFDLLSYYTSKFYEIKDLDLKRYHQVCGNLMLYQYINNSINLLTDEHLIERISYVLTNHICILNKKGYYAKNEVLKSLLILLIKVKKLYSPHAKETMKKILLLIEQNKGLNFEYNLKKSLLDIIYNLIFFNRYEIYEFVDDIIYYVKLIKNDKNKNVRMISMNILNILEEEVKNYDKNNLTYNFHETKKSQNEFINLIRQDKLNKDKKEFILVQKRYNTDIQDDNIIYDTINYKNSNNDSENDNISDNNDNDFNSKSNQNNFKSLDDITNEMNNINERNTKLISLVSDLQSFMNQNYNLIDNKLNNINQSEQNTFLKSQNPNLNHIVQENNNNINTQIPNLILNDDNLINYLLKIPNEEINILSSQNIEDIIKRIILLYSINKNNKKQLYKTLLQKLISQSKNSLSPSIQIITTNLLKSN
jgi:predicted Zn-dependent protease with MMP-like domain